MSFFINEFNTALEKEDFELPIKTLKNEEHEVSYMFAKTGVPSLSIDYPKEVFYETWEKEHMFRKNTPKSSIFIGKPSCRKEVSLES